LQGGALLGVQFISVQVVEEDEEEVEEYETGVVGGDRSDQ
jgi:hypothetical protein